MKQTVEGNEWEDQTQDQIAEQRARDPRADACARSMVYGRWRKFRSSAHHSIGV